MILLLGQALKSLVEHRQHGLHRQVTHNSPPTPPLPNHKTSPVAHSTITQCSRPAEFTNKIKLDPRSTTNKHKPEMAPTWMSRDRQPSVLFSAQWAVSWLYKANWSWYNTLGQFGGHKERFHGLSAHTQFHGQSSRQHGKPKPKLAQMLMY